MGTGRECSKGSLAKYLNQRELSLGHCVWLSALIFDIPLQRRSCILHLHTCMYVQGPDLNCKNYKVTKEAVSLRPLAIKKTLLGEIEI